MNITKLKWLVTIAIATVSMATFAGDAGVNRSVTKLKYFETGIGPLQAALGFGDPANGAHGSFLKIPAGFASPAHIHTQDYHGIVVSGVMANSAPGGQIVEFPVGSYYFQKGGEGHITQCLSATECILFLVQPGKFDFFLDTKARSRTQTDVHAHQE